MDLNNFATFPTLAVGILVADLRNAGFGVRVISPLAHDVPAAERERPEGFLDDLARRLHLSTWPPLMGVRDAARATRYWWKARPHQRVLREVRKALALRPDVLLLSAYLQHRPTVAEVGKLARRHGVPVLIGGPMFNIEAAADPWRKIPGLAAIVGAEVDGSLAELVGAVCRGTDLLRFKGVTLPDGRKSEPAPPLRPFRAGAIPDYTDFPWDLYRLRVIPIMTGRGCQWSQCNFCSDVISVSGRTYRTRSLDHVLHEMREQSLWHDTTNFLFLDLKLNSNPAMLRGIVENIQRQVRGAQWIGTVHVDQRRDNGLSRSELKAAVASGMRRVSFGLESGSQKLLDSMNKGSTVEGNSAFIRDAFDAGLSVRCTMFKGYPGEDGRDLELTADFLERHARFIDRVRLNDFSLPLDTPLYKAISEQPEAYPTFRLAKLDARKARSNYIGANERSRAYHLAKQRVLRAVFEINRRPLRSSARAFDGLM